MDPNVTFFFVMIGYGVLVVSRMICVIIHFCQ